MITGKSQREKSGEALLEPLKTVQNPRVLREKNPEI
jgi:hypothetical protein